MYKQREEERERERGRDALHHLLRSDIDPTSRKTGAASGRVGQFRIQAVLSVQLLTPHSRFNWLCQYEHIALLPMNCANL